MAGRPRRHLEAVHETGARLRCDLADAVQRSIFYTGSYEPTLTSLIRAELRPGDVFLDIGANVGHYSLLAATLVGDEGQVHAVEASAETARLLAHTVARNHVESIITVHNVAASDATRTMILATPSDGHSAVGMRYLTRGDEPGESVTAVRLDEFLAVRPTVVKVDVEGADLRALVGMDHLLVTSPPRAIFVEAIDAQLARFGDSTTDMCDYLSGRGYRSETLVERYFPDSLIFRHDGARAAGAS